MLDLVWSTGYSLPGTGGPLFQMRGSWLPGGILRWPSHFFCPLCSLSPGDTALAGEATHKGCSQGLGQDKT